jgi:hypothetical protein
MRRWVGARVGVVGEGRGLGRRLPYRKGRGGCGDGAEDGWIAHD